MLKTRFTAILIVFLALTAAACGSLPTPGGERTMQEEIHNYFYVTKSLENPDDFVAWANKKLADYSAREIYRALYKEAESHAEQGHPNAIFILRRCARAWAAQKGLEFKQADWDKFWQKAKENERVQPTGELQLWPTPKP